MNICHFELVFKPQSPVPPSDIVLQGFFLKISNLEAETLHYRVSFVTSSVPDPQRTLAGNTVVFVDVAGTDNAQAFTLVGAADAKSFHLCPDVAIPGHATALIALLPADPFPMPFGDGTADPADFEARGYVTLHLPAKLKESKDHPGFWFPAPQRATPARALVTPQHRAVYVGDDGAAKGQTQSSLPLAIPGSEIALEPESKIKMKPDFEIHHPIETPCIDPEDLAKELAGLLALVSGPDTDLKAFNKSLKKAGIAVTLERCKL
ncbi:MAG: hypothetical protein ACOCTP_04580 [Roseicyclus sp.]